MDREFVVVSSSGGIIGEVIRFHSIVDARKKADDLAEYADYHVDDVRVFCFNKNKGEAVEVYSVTMKGEEV